MKNNLIGFNEWERLYESSGSYDASDLRDDLSKEIGKVVYIPDFDKFTRPGEGEQTVQFLFVIDTKQSINVNMQDGDWYSIDVWKSGEALPYKTIYNEGAQLKDMVEPLISFIKEKDPSLNKKEEMVEEKKKNEVDVKVKTPAKRTETLPEIKIDAPYEYGDINTIFRDLRSYTQMVIKGIQPSLLITGSPGVGKSYTVEEEFDKAGLKEDVDWVKIKGKSTAVGLYQALYEYNGKLILLDDCDSIFDDKNAVNILKGALDSGEKRTISWLSGRPLKSGGDPIPHKFDFTGRVIFITNKAQKDLDDAIKTRSFVIEVALSPTDMIKYIKGLMHEVLKDEPMALKKIALQAIQLAAKSNPKVQINMRTFLKAVRILKNEKDLNVAKSMIVQQCSYK